MIRYFFIYLAVINLIAFGLFAVDKKRAVYNGEIEKEDVIYTDGTGSVVFNDNGTFTWKDDRSEYGDILFEWLSTKN